VTSSGQGILLALFGLGALLYLQFVFPRHSNRAATQQHRIVRKFLGHRAATLVQTYYVRGARLALLTAGVGLILFGVLMTVGIVVPK
jgi:hypothetical protein